MGIIVVWAADRVRGRRAAIVKLVVNERLSRLPGRKKDEDLFDSAVVFSVERFCFYCCNYLIGSKYIENTDL